MAKVGKKGSSPQRARSERRFEPQSTISPALVMSLGAAGALAMGAGFYGQFLRGEGLPPLPFFPWLLGGGSLLEGAAVWLGTTSAPPLRVGDGGIALEIDGLRRMPWYALERLSYDGAKRELVANGNDDLGVAWTLRLSVPSYGAGAARLVHEARRRVGGVVDVPEEALAGLPTEGGVVLPLEPVQVVGKRCAASGKLIAFEPDARICPLCERVYFHDSVPEVCACGAQLGVDTVASGAFSAESG